MSDEELELEPTSEELKQANEAKKELIIFWLRMVGWLLTGVGAPITTFAIKFGLFNTYGYQVVVDELGNVVGTQIALNGWGIVSVALIGFAAISIMKEIIDAYSNSYSFVKQCLVGLKNRIIPIGIAIFICWYVKGVIEQILFCLTVIGLSQLAAIPLNPLPKWKAKVKKQEDYSDAITGFVSFLKTKFSRKGDK